MAVLWPIAHHRLAPLPIVRPEGKRQVNTLSILINLSVRPSITLLTDPLQAALHPSSNSSWRRTYKDIKLLFVFRTTEKALLSPSLQAPYLHTEDLAVETDRGRPVRHLEHEVQSPSTWCCHFLHQPYSCGRGNEPHPFTQVYNI